MGRLVKERGSKEPTTGRLVKERKPMTDQVVKQNVLVCIDKKSTSMEKASDSLEGVSSVEIDQVVTNQLEVAEPSVFQYDQAKVTERIAVLRSKAQDRMEDKK